MGGEGSRLGVLASLKKQMGTYAKGRRVNHSLLMSFRKNIKIFILGVWFLFGGWKYSIHPQNKGESGVSPGVFEIFRYRQTHILIPCYFYLITAFLRNKMTEFLLIFLTSQNGFDPNIEKVNYNLKSSKHKQIYQGF